MSFRLSGFKCGLAAATLCLWCGAPAPLRAGESPSPQPDAAGATQETAPAPRSGAIEVPRSGPSSLENRGPRAPATFESLFLRRRPVAVPSPVNAPGRRSQSLLDREGDWVFVTPEDVIHDYMMREILKVPEYGPDGRDTSTLSPVERYYERTSRRHSATNSAAARSDFLDPFDLRPPGDRPGEGDSANGASATGGALPKLPASLRDLQGMNYYDTDRARSSLPAGFSGLNKRDDFAAAEAVRDRKQQEEHLDAVKKIWGFQQPPAPIAGPAMVQPGISLRPGPGGGVWPTSGPRLPYGMSAMPSSPPAVPGMPAVPGASFSPSMTAIPGQLFMPDLPAALPAVKPAPPKSEFSVPKRRF